MAKIPQVLASTVFAWGMDDPTQGNQHAPLLDQGGSNNLDLSVLVSEDNAPWIVHGEDGKTSFARYTNGNRKFFFNNSNQAAIASFIQSDWTMEFRFNFESLPTVSEIAATIFEIRGFSDSEADNHQMRVLPLDDGTINTFWEHGAGVNVDQIFASTIIGTGPTTLQIRGVWTGASLELFMYVDGVFKESKSATGPTGGTTAVFSMFGEVVSIGGGTSTFVMRGSISSFHWIAADIGATLLQSRSSLHKFTSLGSTFALHNFPEQPSQRDEGGIIAGMNPGPFTDISSVTGPVPSQGLVCDDGKSKSFPNGTTYLMIPNHPAVRDPLKAEFTLEFWFRHYDGPVTDIGFFEWFDAGATEPLNSLFRFFLDRTGSAWRPRFRYEHSVNVGVDVTGSVDVLDEIEGGTKDHRFKHHIAVVGRNNGGNREFDVYLDAVFLETVVMSAILATGGEDADHGRFGVSGTATSMDGEVDGVRFSNVALTQPQLQTSFDDGKTVCAGPVDLIPPVVTYVDPLPGTKIRPEQAITVDVTDETGLMCNVGLSVIYETARPRQPEETIYKGTRFSEFYTESTKTAIANGFRFVLKRIHPDPARRVEDPGWPATPTFDADPVDFGGNRST